MVHPARRDILPAPALPTSIYVLFSLFCVLMSSGITSFAKNNGEMATLGFFKQLTFYFKKTLGFMQLQVFQNCCSSNVQPLYALNANFARALDKGGTRRIYPHTCTCTINFLLAKQMNALLLVFSAAQITPRPSLKLTFSA